MKSVSAEEAESVKEQDIAKQKISCTVYQESGTNPATISVVLPTFNNGNDEYIKTMQMVMRKIGKLIDRGAVDELVIVDGSRDDKGMPDADFIKFMLALCIKNCETFRKEVDFVRSMPEGKQRGMEGRFDFSVRFLSQLDPLLHKIFLDHELLTQDELEFLKKGKGAGLWYSIPVTYGDIICFVDSDIKSFRKFYVGALCKPILDTWKSDCKSRDCSPDIVFSKAVYTRKNETAQGFKMGGRLQRAGMAPLFRALAKRGCFEGLEKLDYHVSGECAFYIDALKDIHFSNGYDIETSILCQLWKEYGMGRIAQVDLGIYQHIPGSDDHVSDMMREIASAIKHWCTEYGMPINRDDLSKVYAKEGYAILEEYWAKAKRLEGFSYDSSDRLKDSKRVDEFTRILKESWEGEEKPKLLRAWKELEEKANAEHGYSYQNLKLSLRKRINKFTSNMILSSIYIDRSDDIIQKYTSVHGP
jgi:hypothetical protein